MDEKEEDAQVPKFSVLLQGQSKGPGRLPTGQRGEGAEGRAQSKGPGRLLT